MGYIAGNMSVVSRRVLSRIFSVSTNFAFDKGTMNLKDISSPFPYCASDQKKQGKVRISWLPPPVFLIPYLILVTNQILWPQVCRKSFHSSPQLRDIDNAGRLIGAGMATVGLSGPGIAFIHEK